MTTGSDIRGSVVAVGDRRSVDVVDLKVNLKVSEVTPAAAVPSVGRPVPAAAPVPVDTHASLRASATTPGRQAGDEWAVSKAAAAAVASTRSHAGRRDSVDGDRDGAGNLNLASRRRSSTTSTTAGIGSILPDALRPSKSLSVDTAGVKH